MLDLYIMAVSRRGAPVRLHIAEFPKQFMLFAGFPLRIAAAVMEVGR
jgi:hypothetical protein